LLQRESSAQTESEQHPYEVNVWFETIPHSSCATEAQTPLEQLSFSAQSESEEQEVELVALETGTKRFAGGGAQSTA